MSCLKLNHVKAILFDLDGCIYQGNRLEEKADFFIRWLHDRGIHTCFLTNNSISTGKEIADKLQRMGLRVEPDSIVTVTDVAGEYIRDKYGKRKVKVYGSDSLSESVERSGHQVLRWYDESVPDIVLAGRDVQFRYAKLVQMLKDLQNGARLIAGNPDLTHPNEDGYPVPETGLFVAGLESVSRFPIEYIGKPNPYMYHWVSSKYSFPLSGGIMVGDNLLTDIKGGVQAGMRTCWIRLDPTNVPDTQCLEVYPDFIVSSFSMLVDEVTA